jgi:hypothetical protein
MSTSGTMDARRNPPSNAVPNFSMEDKRVAVELKQEIKELWTLHMDDIQYLKNLVESMPSRLEAVILNEGNSTKY